MKKILSVATLIFLAGCNADTGHVYQSGFVDVGDFGRGYDLVRDPSTGCIYLFDADNYSVSSPYIDEDGEVVGCGEENFNKSKYQ